MAKVIPKVQCKRCKRIIRLKPPVSPGNASYKYWFAECFCILGSNRTGVGNNVEGVAESANDAIDDLVASIEWLEDENGGLEPLAESERFEPFEYARQLVGPGWKESSRAYNFYLYLIPPDHVTGKGSEADIVRVHSRNATRDSVEQQCRTAVRRYTERTGGTTNSSSPIDPPDGRLRRQWLIESANIVNTVNAKGDPSILEEMRCKACGARAEIVRGLCYYCDHRMTVDAGQSQPVPEPEPEVPQPWEAWATPSWDDLG